MPLRNISTNLFIYNFSWDLLFSLEMPYKGFQSRLLQVRSNCPQDLNRRVGNQIYTRKLATGIPGYSTRFDVKN